MLYLVCLKFKAHHCLIIGIMPTEHNHTEVQALQSENNELRKRVNLLTMNNESLTNAIEDILGAITDAGITLGNTSSFLLNTSQHYRVSNKN
jgi:hypothetical protein